MKILAKIILKLPPFKGKLGNLFYRLLGELAREHIDSFIEWIFQEVLKTALITPFNGTIEI